MNYLKIESFAAVMLLFMFSAAVVMAQSLKTLPLHHTVNFQPLPVPQQAAAVGYNLNTFNSNVAPDEIDLNDTREPGFNWYRGHFYGAAPTNINNLSFNLDQSLTLTGSGPRTFNQQILTAAPTADKKGWVGTAFGGGFYIEAIFKFNPQDTINTAFNGWPSFWSFSIEATNSDGQWPGQSTGYANTVEPDFFEYDLKSMPVNYYGGCLHEWYGIYKQTCSTGYCQVALSYNDSKRELPADVDFTQFHKYGFLWVPATDNNPGYAQYFFDDQPVGKEIFWQKYDPYADVPAPPAADNSSWTFSVLDTQHLVIALGTGIAEPMTVKAVHVWQHSVVNNLVKYN